MTTKRNRQIEYLTKLELDPDYNRKRHQRESKFSKYRSDAKYRGIEFKLTREQFDELVKLPCYYCGGFTKGKTVNGLDRVRSSKGYVKSNVRPCCKMCNVGKLDYSEREYIEHCKKVAEHNGYKV